jgi:hypothetical protein
MKRIAISLLPFVLAAAGCDNRPQTSTAAPTPWATEIPAQPWMRLPTTEWPQMVLTNETKFKGHTALHGASSFLLQAPDGRIVAATALHLLGENGGVDPAIAPEQLPAVLSSWQMFPRTKPDSAVTITGLAYKAPVKKSLDWLLLTVAPRTTGPLPALPLTISPLPVSIGDEVFLVGVPYVEKDRAQNVYRGRVTERGFGDRFRYSIDPPVDIRGFSGAPILNKYGYVVGVMSVWFEPKMQGEKFLEAGGEDAASIAAALNSPP